MKDLLVYLDQLKPILSHHPVKRVHVVNQVTLVHRVIKVNKVKEVMLDPKVLKVNVDQKVHPPQPFNPLSCKKQRITEPVSQYNHTPMSLSLSS